ncbi:MAG: hypothetical protein HOP08_00955 [Cyclobacteriaceae bacterium]|nr:hypothetical protein [Cyclobacteriaceae bacterium]
MKLLIITCLKEYQKEVARMLGQAGITVFSVSQTMGFKENHDVNLLDSWFSNGQEHFDSIFFFSFTTETSAENALKLIKAGNEATETDFPIRVFIVPVEKSNYSI